MSSELAAYDLEEAEDGTPSAPDAAAVGVWTTRIFPTWEDQPQITAELELLLVGSGLALIGCRDNKIIPDRLHFSVFDLCRDQG